MSTANETDLKGKYDEVAGKVKQSAGEAFNNDKIANEGAAQEVKGHGEQAWGSVKQAAGETQTRQEANTHETAHNLRDSVTSAAQHVKESIQNAVSGSHDKDR